MPKVLIDVQKAQICRFEETPKRTEVVGILGENMTSNYKSGLNRVRTKNGVGNSLKRKMILDQKIKSLKGGVMISTIP